MSAAKKNLTIEQKATFSLLLVYRDRLKRPISLVGYDAKMQVRDALTGALLSDLSVTNSKIVLGGALGTIQITIPETETATMTFTQANYDIKLIAPDGTQSRLLEGKMFLSLGQTA